jgi:hypothetical protein
MMASASFDKTVKLWDARTGQELRTLLGHTERVTGVAFSAGEVVGAHKQRSGQMLASVGEHGTVKLWDARTGQELRTLLGHIGKASIAFAPDGHVLTTPGRLDMLAVTVTSAAFAADGHVLASGHDEGTVKLWNARTGQDLHTLRGHAGEVTSVAFAPDGQVLASAGGADVRHGGGSPGDNTVKLWDVRTGQELRTLAGHTGPVRSVAFGADGQLLASASEDQTVKLWDSRTGQELRTLRGHTKFVTSVAFSADGQVLASASDDKTVKLWDARTGQPESERRFRLLVTAPDRHRQREQAEAADKVKHSFALAFHLGRYLAAKNYYATAPKEAATLAGWFPDGIACTGVLYKDSGIAPARLLLGTARALEGDPTSWLNHALHGGALFRNGRHAEALAALTQAAAMHGKASPLTHHLLAVTHLAMGQAHQAKQALARAEPDLDAPWEDVYLNRLLRPEVEAALAKAER